MSTLTRIAAAGLALATLGCTGVKITTDFDPAAVPAMQGYQTYRWIPDTGPREDPELNNPIVIGRIQTAVNTALQAKGYREVSSGGDFLVGWHADVDQRTSYTTVNDYYGYGWGRWGYYGGGMGTSRTTEQRWEEGTLVILIADAGTEQLVWHGTATAEIGKAGTPEERQRRVNDAVAQMFKDFPPGQ